MTEISSFGMVSYYNPLAVCRQQQQQPGTGATGISQQLSPQAQQYVAQAQAQHAAVQQQIRADSSPPQQYWYGYPGHPAHPAHHHHHHQTSAPQQYLDHAADVLGWPPHHPHHYSHHLQYQHQQAAYQQHQQQQQQQQQAQQAQLAGTVSEWSGDESSTHHHQQQQAVIAGEPSPPITVSGSEMSSPGTPSTPPANNNNNNPNATNNNNSASTTPMRPSQIRSPFEWMKKPSYQSQPNPACNVAAIDAGSVTGLHELCPLDVIGKTRTKDKYRVVYTDHQRLELEKEFHYSRYITIRRKAELASNLALSERQVKIWFQNRRAKERKQSKKREELEHKDIKPGDMGAMGPGGMASLAALGGMGGMLGGLMHNGNTESLSLGPLNLGPPPHSLAGIGHSASSLHAHQHAHPHAILGL